MVVEIQNLFYGEGHGLILITFCVLCSAEELLHIKVQKKKKRWKDMALIFEEDRSWAFYRNTVIQSPVRVRVRVRVCSI